MVRTKSAASARLAQRRLASLQMLCFASCNRSRAAESQMARLISAAAAATIPITEAVAAPVQKPFAQSSA